MSRAIKNFIVNYITIGNAYDTPSELIASKEPEYSKELSLWNIETVDGTVVFLNRDDVSMISWTPIYED